MQLSQRRNHIGAEAAFIRQFRTWLKDTPIDLPAEMLQELAKDHSVVKLCPAMRINIKTCLRMILPH
jgi:hypothetical protein